jgi:16S rRNA (guanine966-N2)-methyltransferase
MRIIGGTHKGRIIKRVEKITTRETSDMVRESVFNMLGVNLSGVVLDLFGGSGAYGLESVSRGASACYLVDIDQDAIKVIKENAAILKMETFCYIYRMDYQTFIKNNPSLKFDYIFLDPPYKLNIYEEVISMLEKLTTDDTIIICELDQKLDLPDEISKFIKIKNKTYGKKRICIYEVNKQ